MAKVRRSMGERSRLFAEILKLETLQVHSVTRY
jgi:hypothetical protein